VFLRKDCFQSTSRDLFLCQSRPLSPEEEKRLLSVDWSARDTQGDTLFKCAEGWVSGFKSHPPVTRVLLNQSGFSLARRRQGYCSNTVPFKKMCLVLDPPMVTQEGEVAPVTGHFAFRTLWPRSPYNPPYNPDSLAVSQTGSNQ